MGYSLQEIPVKNLSNLKYAKKKLQHFLVKELESLDYTNRLCLAKMNNPAFYQFLLDNTDSSASSFFSQIPQIYGLLLNNEEWETFIRLRCYLWPQQLVNGLKCKCNTPVSLTHLFNCQHLVTFRRCLHDNVYKDIYQMAKAFGIEIFPEPVLRKLQDVSFSDDNRGDLIMSWFKSSQLIIDVVTADPCNATNESSSVNVVNKAEARKISKYSDLLSKLNDSQFKKYVFTPFGISVYGRVGDSGLKFLEDFRCFVKERHNKRVNLSYWTNRIVFSCFKSLPEMISRSLKFIGSHYESLFGIDGSIDGVDFGCFEL
ncbi:hypothetical protein RCL1_006659 [Eukaryota sp. TZLM3-RCL]